MKNRKSLLNGAVLAATLLTQPLWINPAAAQNACPTRTKQQWQQWLNQQADAFPRTDWTTVYQTMTACEPTFRREGLLPCMTNLGNFAKTRLRSDAQGMGMIQTNEVYLNNQPQELMKLPTEFANGLPENWETVAKTKGWPYLRYSSRTVPNPPHSSFTRLLFFVSKPTHDQWIQFTYPNQSPSRNERLIDFITVQKKEGTRNIFPHKIHFRQYWRDETGRNPKLQVGSGDNCYACHPGGMRRISPEPKSLANIGFVTGDPQQTIGAVANLPFYRLNQFNEIMRNYGKLDWAGGIIPEHHGPGMGKFTVNGSTVNCASCHDGVSRGTVNATTAQSHVEHKLTKDLTMPPSPNIVPQMEKALVGENVPARDMAAVTAAANHNAAAWAVIKREYPNQVKLWLKERSCVTAMGSNDVPIEPEKADRAIASDAGILPFVERKLDRETTQF